MKNWMIATIIATGLLLSSAGCTINSADNPSSLPTNAKIISQEGNGWIIFEFQGKQFLYHKAASGYNGYESITILPK